MPSAYTTKFLLKPAAVCIGLSLAAHAYANLNPPPAPTFVGPFSQIPLHLQETVISGGGGVKPNVVLQIDNSGSMGYRVDGHPPNHYSESRINITRAALLRLLGNSKYRNTVNWQMTTLYENGKHQLWSNYARQYLNGTQPFGRPPADLERVIGDHNTLQPENLTPSTERYLDSIYLLQKALMRPDAQQCQKSYAILFSDGNQNGWTVKMEKRRDSNGLETFQLAPKDKQSNLDHPNPQGAEPTIVFAHEQPFQYRHPNLAAFKITHRDPSQDPLNFLTFDSNGIFLPNVGYDTKGWNWETEFTLKNPILAHDVRLWTNRSNSLRYFAETVFENDLAPHLPGKQNIETYTIAFGIDPQYEPNAYVYLSGGATASGGVVLNADNAQELDNAFEKIFSDIASKNRFEPPPAYAGVSPTLSREDLAQKLPNMAAALHLNLQSGSSEIRFYNIQSNDKGFDVNRTAFTRPSFGNRKFLINNGSSTGWLQNFAGSNDYFAIPNQNGNTDEWRLSLLPWLMRNADDRTLNNSSNALKYRVRTATAQLDKRNMGDVISSPITAYGPVYNGKQKYLVTAANDGMVYLFTSSDSNYYPYDLKLNYIPAAMERESETDTLAKHFKNIVDPDYVVDANNYPHRYMINGGFTLRTMDSSGARHTFMAGNMGQGGRGSYALNLGGEHRQTGQPTGIDAPSDEWPSSVPLFETPKGANNRMGYTIGSPQIGRIAFSRSVERNANAKMAVNLNDVRYGVFIGSGVRHPQSYQPGNDSTESALYVFNAMQGVNVGLKAAGVDNTQPNYDMAAGTQIAKIPAPGGSGGLAQPTIVDINLDGVVDVAYAGDYKGGLYRFDLRGPVNEWTAHKIFQTANGQPITSAPAVLREDQNKYVVIFGTGSDLYPEDLKDNTTQSVYGIYDDLTDFTPTAKGVGNLTEQTITQSVFTTNGKSHKVRQLSDNALNGSAGWFFRLPDTGERVVVKPNMMLKTVLLVSRMYKEEIIRSNNNGNMCTAESERRRTSSESWIMQVKADNGGNLPGRGRGNDVYAYADFLKQKQPDGGRPDVIFSGLHTNGIYNPTLLVGSNNAEQIGGFGNAVSMDGDSGGNGIDPELDPYRDPVRRCFSTKDNRLLGGNTDNGTGVDAQSTSIEGEECEYRGSIRRMSWRELF